MSRRRKVAVSYEEKENVRKPSSKKGADSANSSSELQIAIEEISPQQVRSICAIMAKIQVNETHHKKFLHELKQFYLKVSEA